MRILFALHAYLPDGRGGTEIHAHAVARMLSRAHTVRIVAREGDPTKPDFAVTRSTVDGVEVTRINNLYARSDNFEWTYKNARVHDLFEKELVDFAPDLVHIHHLTGLSTTIVETIKAGGLPCVMSLHDFWTVCPRGQRMTKELQICDNVDRNLCFHCLSGIWPNLFENRDAHRTVLDSRGRLAPENLAEFDRHMAYILGLVDVLITPSEFHRERMLDFPLPADRMVALPHGLDHRPFRGVVRPRRPVTRIGYVGSVTPVKGIHVLVDAFRMLERSDLELHIHGEGFPFHDDRNYGERLKSRTIGQRNIHMHGAYRPADLPRILAGLDVLVVPSLWWETFCLTIREGQLAGLPVIASDIGAMREALDGERDGLLFRAGDARDLADRLLQIINDDDLRDRLSNRQEAVKPIEQYVEELLPLYERAQRVSAERRATLVVAPPWFADSTTTHPTLPRDVVLAEVSIARPTEAVAPTAASRPAEVQPERRPPSARESRRDPRRQTPEPREVAHAAPVNPPPQAVRSNPVAEPTTDVAPRPAPTSQGPPRPHSDPRPRREPRAPTAEQPLRTPQRLDPLPPARSLADPDQPIRTAPPAAPSPASAPGHGFDGDLPSSARLPRKLRRQRRSRRSRD